MVAWNADMLITTYTTYFIAGAFPAPNSFDTWVLQFVIACCNPHKLNISATSHMHPCSLPNPSAAQHQANSATQLPHPKCLCEWASKHSSESVVEKQNAMLPMSARIQSFYSTLPKLSVLSCIVPKVDLQIELPDYAKSTFDATTGACQYGERSMFFIHKKHSICPTCLNGKLPHSPLNMILLQWIFMSQLSTIKKYFDVQTIVALHIILSSRFGNEPHIQS